MLIKMSVYIGITKDMTHNPSTPQSILPPTSRQKVPQPAV